jgi:beta-lactam-binding protein with PASTA domain
MGVAIKPDTNSLQHNGLIKEIRYYDERLVNATLEDMSNGSFPVPNVVGLTEAEATATLEAEGFEVSVSGGGGLIAEQSPAAGTTAAEGTTVTVTIPAKGGRPRRKPRYVVEVDGQTLVADNITQVESILATAREIAQDAADRATVNVVRKPPKIKVKTSSGNPTTSKVIQDAVSRTQKAVNRAYLRAAEERKKRRDVDKEISARMQQKLMEEDDEEAITVLLL